MSFFDDFSLLPQLNSFLHPERGYEDASKTLADYWNQAKGYMGPYAQNGLDQYGRLNDAENALLDPGALYNKWAQSYQESPYAQQMAQKATNAGMDAASSMGLMGSSTALNNIQQSASDIMNKDRQQYLNDLMQKYMAGIGIGQNIYGTGAGMGQALGQGAINMGQMQGQAAFGQANAPGDLFGKLLGTAAGIFSGGGF